MTELEISSETEKPVAKERNWKNFLKMYLVLGVLFLIMFTMRSTLTSLQMFVPYISASISEPVEIVVIMFIVYSSTAAVFSLFVGPITERIGYKIVMNTGMFIFTIAIMLIALAPKFWVMAVGEGIAGIGGACFGPAAIAYAGDYFPKKQLSTAIGLIMSSFYVGTIVAVPLIAFVAEKLVWQWGIGIMAILSFIVSVLILLIVPRIKGKRIKAVDADFEKETEFEDITKEISQNENQSYFARMKLVLKNKYAVGTFFITLFQRGGLFGMITLLSTWLTQEDFWNNFDTGLNKTQVGLVFLGGGVAALISNTIFSYVADKIGRRRIILIGTSLTGITIGLFPLIGEITRNMPLAIAGIITINFFGGVAMGSYNAFITQIIPKSKATTVAINSSFGQVSQLMANALIATVVWNLTGNYAYCGFVALGFFTITVILMLFIVKPDDFFERINSTKNLG
ncbi:MAG: MFS transporter [Candidatus Heimdallarchaeota archaeon]|nr:MFS transporter [Candidatus Heimdallarchaeota archaeon]MBY8995426.1 MFS transporter [Candidatus Heimdallarchaeota archaeon]